MVETTCRFVDDEVHKDSKGMRVRAYEVRVRGSLRKSLNLEIRPLRHWVHFWQCRDGQSVAKFLAFKNFSASKKMGSSYFVMRPYKLEKGRVKSRCKSKVSSHWS